MTVELIRIKAIEFARESGLMREQFKGSIYWVRCFMRCKGFALRLRAYVCQKLPEAYEDKLVEFQHCHPCLAAAWLHAWRDRKRR